MRAVRLLLAVVVVMICAVPAVADAIFDVTGSLTITGTNACGGPCVETVDFSFDVTWDEFAPGEFNPVILPGAQVTSSGPLGSFMPPVGSIGNNFIALFDGLGSPIQDEIDIDVLNAPIASSPQPLDLGPGGIGGADLYSCGTATCVTDFADAVFPNSGVPAFGIFLPGTVHYTETALPESSTLSYLLLALGLGLLGVFARRPMMRRFRDIAPQAFRV